MQRYRYRFTVLRHDDPRHAYYWLLRTPVSAGVDGTAGFSGVLFKDFVADTRPLVNATRNYIRLDLQRDSELSNPLCADEYEMCSDSIMEVGSIVGRASKQMIIYPRSTFTKPVIYFR